MSAAVTVAKAHSELGASGADRWMNCPGSVALSRGRPDQDTDFTREGTAAHTLAEKCLKDHASPWMFVGMEIDGIEVTDEMAESLELYINVVKDAQGATGTLLVEQRFDLSSLQPPAAMFGTGDATVLRDRVLYVIDLKYGRGYAVSAKGNPQLQYYGLGALLALPPELASQVDEVELVIVQPRAQHAEGRVRRDRLPFGAIVAFAQELMAAASATQQPNALLKAGGWCRFCKAAAVCPEQRRQAQELAQIDFADPLPMPPEPTTLPIEVIASLLNKVDILEDWIKALRRHAHAELEAGREVPGFKLVPKRATRKWASDEQALRTLQDQGVSRDQLVVEKIKSVAVLEKLLGKGAIPGALVTKESSGSNIVPMSNPTPALVAGPAADFTVTESSE